MTEVTKIIDHAIYPRRAVAEARHAYREYCFVKVSPLPRDRAQLVISVGEAHKAQAREVVLGFLNYLLDRSVELSLEST